MGIGVCSNLASSGEPPPASHVHFNHWVRVRVTAAFLFDFDLTLTCTLAI